MKKFFAFLLVALLATSFAYATSDGHYNVTNFQATGTINVTGSVNQVDLKIVPPSQNLSLGGINPGQTKTYNLGDAANYVMFTLSGAQGYKVKWTASVNLTDNLTYIVAKVYCLGYTTGWENIPAGTGYTGTLTIPESTPDGAAYTKDVYVGVSEFKADPGAVAGTRSFTLTCNAEYQE